VIRNGWLIAMTKRVASEEAVVERRRSRRFTVDWDVVVRGMDELGSNFDEAGSLRDLSSRGAFLSLPKQLRVGMRLELWIRMPAEPERWMAYSAEIVRIDKSREGLNAATKFLTARPKLHSTPRPASGGNSS
jgi:hypothetical protein